MRSQQESEGLAPLHLDQIGSGCLYDISMVSVCFFRSGLTLWCWVELCLGVPQRGHPVAATSTGLLKAEPSKESLELSAHVKPSPSD